MCFRRLFHRTQLPICCPTLQWARAIHYTMFLGLVYLDATTYASSGVARAGIVPQIICFEYLKCVDIWRKPAMQRHPLCAPCRLVQLARRLLWVQAQIYGVPVPLQVRNEQPLCRSLYWHRFGKEWCTRRPQTCVDLFHVCTTFP